MAWKLVGDIPSVSWRFRYRQTLVIDLSGSFLLCCIQAKVRLRALGLPVTLFGETNAQRSARLLQAEEDKGHHQDDFNLKDGHNVVSAAAGFVNDA